MLNIERFAGLTLRFSETMEGYASSRTDLDYEQACEVGRTSDYTDPVKVNLTVVIDDLREFFQNPEHEGSVCGTIDFSRSGASSGFEIENGRFKLFNKDAEGTRHLEYTFNWTNMYGVVHTFHGIKNIKDNPGYDSLDDITVLNIDITSDPNERGINKKGIIRFDPKDFPKLFGSIEVETPSFLTQVLAKTAFLAFCAGEMASEYVVGKLGDRK